MIQRTKIPPMLKQGYGRFREQRFAIETQRYQALAEGQSPRTMVIGCADSRVDPAAIFSAAPGELFVVRNVAALVPPFEETGTYHGTSAAIEFAVENLRVENVVVMGHGLCGGIAASLAEANNVAVGRFIKPWVGLLSSVRDEMLKSPEAAVPAGHQKRLEHLAVRHSLDNLMTFPFVASAIATRGLALHGAWFSIAEGELDWLDFASGEFETINV